MGTVYNRGTRAKPNWWVKYKDANGKFQYTPSKQPTKTLAKKFLEQIEANIANGRVGIVEPSSKPTISELMPIWLGGLRNRNADDDRSRVRRHVLPAFAERTLDELNLATIMGWIDRQRAAGNLADASIRHNLNLLSRFFSWAIERGHAEFNPVKQIPRGRRPQQSPKRDAPWLRDDALVVRIIRELPEPLNYMFYLGNRSGLRTGEICGLRLSDFGFIGEGIIRVRFSYDGPLKEDKDEQGKVKWVPAPDDCEAFVGPWVAAREAAGVGPEGYVFPSHAHPDRHYSKRHIERQWEEIRERQDLGLTWYQATRHSFVSRNLEAGVSLDEVSAAVGHSSPVVTKRYYDHFIRKSYSPRLRSGLGLGGPKDDSPFHA
jgi:integrase